LDQHILFGHGRERRGHVAKRSQELARSFLLKVCGQMHFHPVAEDALLVAYRVGRSDRLRRQSVQCLRKMLQVSFVQLGKEEGRTLNQHGVDRDMNEEGNNDAVRGDVTRKGQARGQIVDTVVRLAVFRQELEPERYHTRQMPCLGQMGHEDPRPVL
jgi:hypothetical protein